MTIDSRAAPVDSGLPTIRVRVWDLPTRLFHWLLALAVIAAVATAWIGGNAMVWHTRCGLGVLILLLFRLGWGLVGGRWSRFRAFVYPPSALRRYLRGASRADEHHAVAHSPLGALSVFAMLLVLAAQVATGLLADDEIATTGPLASHVSGATSARATSWHHGPGQYLVIGLVVLHVLAIGWYAVRRTNLVGPMWSGDKLLTTAAPPAVDNARTRLAAAALLAVAVAAAGWVWSLGG